jgi:hypothetical protein
MAVSPALGQQLSVRAGLNQAAAIEHDCPWQAWEMAPEFDSATGLPRAFNALSGEGCGDFI